MSNKKYHGITNEELLILHEIIKDKYNYFTQGIKKKELLSINKEGQLAKRILTDTDINYIKEQEWFLLLESTSNKLKNIIPLLLEVDEYKNLYEKIKT